MHDNDGQLFDLDDILLCDSNCRLVSPLQFINIHALCPCKSFLIFFSCMGCEQKVLNWTAVSLS